MRKPQTPSRPIVASASIPVIPELIPWCLELCWPGIDRATIANLRKGAPSVDATKVVDSIRSRSAALLNRRIGKAKEQGDLLNERDSTLRELRDLERLILKLENAIPENADGIAIMWGVAIGHQIAKINALEFEAAAEAARKRSQSGRAGFVLTHGPDKESQWKDWQCRYDRLKAQYPMKKKRTLCQEVANELFREGKMGLKRKGKERPISWTTIRNHVIDKK